jgi:bifunctional UDP-N-acetylglucosamine pyrophosphorylase/glucosamine-1-phosphate N-acetyltransferase
MKTINTVVLAAGKGTRMHSKKPKVLQILSDKTLLQHVLHSASQVCDKTIVVYGFEGEAVKKSIFSEVVWVEQAQQLGTGHAVTQALKEISDDTTTLILYGDVPLIQPATLKNLLEKSFETGVALLSVVLKNPTGYGRVIRKNHKVQAIVEQKDANQGQLEIHEVNTGIMAVDSVLLKKYLSMVDANNAQGEFYLTDIIALAVKDKKTIGSVVVANEYEVMGVNDKSQLATLERFFQKNQAEKFMQCGLSIKDPSRFDCRGTLSFGMDCEVDINTVFIGKVVLGAGVKILPNCVIENATIQDNAIVGPFARIRPGTIVGMGAKIGNFVEVKKSTIGDGSKVSHLSYIGDASIGAGVNIGAGVITCNYDGVNKHQTLIEDNAFIGSSSQLVAPIKVGENSTIGAGSTITKDVAKAVLSLSRAKQTTLPNWQKPKKI